MASVRVAPVGRPAAMAVARPVVGPAAHVRRYTEIAGILVRYGFVDVVEALHLRRYVAAGRRMLSAFGRPVQPAASRAVRLRLAFEELGPTFIKFGQALSTRSDLLPPEVVAELTLLQDNVPPLAGGVAERAIEAALGRSIDDLFLEFDPVPLAAASIAQVHRATLRSGAVVAVKVRRPGLATVVEADLAILADLAALAERHWPDAALYSLGELVAEFARTIRREQDLVREGRLIERFASQFASDPTVRLPRIYWPFSRPAVLTMEFLDGVKVSAVGTAGGPDLDRRLVARRGADAVLRQVLVNGLFHADPHPGNILVLPGSVVAFVDFGIVGRLDRRMRDRLAEIIMAIHAHDAGRLAGIVVTVATPLRPVDMRGAVARPRRNAGPVCGPGAGAAVAARVVRVDHGGDGSPPAEAAGRSPAAHQVGDDHRGGRPPARSRVQDRRTRDAARDIASRGEAQPRRAGASHGPWGTRGTGRHARAGRQPRRDHPPDPNRRYAGPVRPSQPRLLRARDGPVQQSPELRDRHCRRSDRLLDRRPGRRGPQLHGYPVLGLAGFMAAGVLGLGLAVGILRSGRL